jgi:epoxyqueuosine reductase QueG
MDTCPAHAIRDRMVTQKLCRSTCEGKTAKGYPLYVCNMCRRVCPNGMGQSKRLKEAV